MTAKEYLKQAYLLDKQIEYEIRNLEQLKSMRGQLQSYTYDERIGTNPNRNLEAPFIRTIEKIWDCEQRINEKIDRFVDLKAEIENAVDSMEDAKERMVLKYRYLQMMDWYNISDVLRISLRSVHRFHASGLQNFVVPEK